MLTQALVSRLLPYASPACAPQAVRLWECSWATQCLEESAAAMPGVAEGTANRTASSAVDAMSYKRTTSLLQAFVLAVIVGERRHVLQHCVSGDDVICHFATIRIRFGAVLNDARRLLEEL